MLWHTDSRRLCPLANGLVIRLLEHELSKRDDTLAAACRAANRDKALQREIDEWQSFDDGIEE